MNAQFNPGIVYLKAGDSIKGLIKIRTFDGIKYKENKNSDEVIYYNSALSGFNISYDNELVAYRLKTVGNGFPRRMTFEITGKVNLYSKSVYNPGHSIPGGFAGGGMTVGGGSSTIYFLEIKNKLIRIGPKLKKKHYKLFSNCPAFIEKFNAKDIKKTEITEVIAFYNKKCE